MRERHFLQCPLKLYTNLWPVIIPRNFYFCLLANVGSCQILELLFPNGSHPNKVKNGISVDAMLYADYLADTFL